VDDRAEEDEEESQEEQEGVLAMANRPQAMLTHYCKSCGALVALIAPGALVYDTRLQCGHCQSMLLINKSVDRQRSKVCYNEFKALESPA